MEERVMEMCGEFCVICGDASVDLICHACRVLICTRSPAEGREPPCGNLSAPAVDPVAR
jgi:hypothetical protein